MSGRSAFETPAAERVDQKAADRGMGVDEYLSAATLEARTLTHIRGTLPGLVASPNGSRTTPEAPDTPVVADEGTLQAGGSAALGPVVETQ